MNINIFFKKILIFLSIINLKEIIFNLTLNNNKINVYYLNIYWILFYFIIFYIFLFIYLYKHYFIHMLINENRIKII